MTSNLADSGHTVLPLRGGTPERFAALRDLLTRAQYQADRICSRLGLATLHDYDSHSTDQPAAPPSDALDILIRLFLDQTPLDRGLVRSLLPAADIGTLETFGLLISDEADAGAYRSSVMLYPTDSLYVTSDRRPAAGESRTTEFVYSAISDSTRRFLAPLPSDPCESFLELCAGTGIAALRAARHSGHAWATDISERATRFAQFNGLLNELQNFTAVRSDLFEALAGRTFDRICAHPPYMPAVEQELLCRDGGQDGEQITRAIVAGLPTFLRPGGRFYCYCMMSDRARRPVEDRLREMLGDAAGEFDVAVVALDRFRPEEYYALLLSSESVTASAAQAHLEALKGLQVRQLLFCWIVIQRARHPRGVFTVRRSAGKDAGHRHVDWLVRRESAALESGTAESLLEAKPTRSSAVHLNVTHELATEGWAPTERSLSTTTPFPLTAKCASWAAQFVADCDGRTSVREHLESLRQSGLIAEETSQDTLLSSVGVLLAGGFVYVDGLEPPGALRNPSVSA
jgi:SAM-dependent methyltransferase